MTEDVARLVETVERAASMLHASGETHWGDWLSLSAAEMRRDDGHGVVRLLQAYGGMGSFTDLILHDELDRLRSEIYALARPLARELARRHLG